MENVYIVICFVTAMMVVGYAAMRLIDYLFTKGEDKRRYQYVKGVIHYGAKQATRMSDQLVHQLNENLFNTIQKMGDL